MQVVTVGKIYKVKRERGLIEMELLAIIPPRDGQRTHYRLKNLKTGREILIRSHTKILFEVN